MSYEPTNWKDGDLVTSAKLNKLEQGVAGAGGGSVLVVNMTIDNDSHIGRLDKTAGEIYEVFRNGSVRFIFTPADGYETFINLYGCQIGPEGYSFQILQFPAFYAATADDYPTTEQPTGGSN